VDTREPSAPKADTRSGDNFQTSAPQLSLPKGGGAIRGIGEKFAANPVTGTWTMSVPIIVSPGRSGFQPQLQLSYDSGAGNGIFGLGWRLSLSSISRKTDKGLPRYDDTSESDVFILSDSEDLVPELTADNKTRNEQPRDGYVVLRYRPRVEGLFSRIERWRNPLDASDTFWRAISRDNVTTVYGRTTESRVFDPTDPGRIFSWLICESYDDKGNTIVYSYKPEDDTNIDPTLASEHYRSIDANRHLKFIRYGNQQSRLSSTAPGQPTWLFEVVFDYGEHDDVDPRPDDAGAWQLRRDPFSTYRAGFEIRTYRLCRRVLMFHHFEDEDIGRDCLVRSTNFSYRALTDSATSLMVSATQTGYQRTTNGNGYLLKSLPPLQFEYTEAAIDDRIRDVDAESLENLPIGLDGGAYQWIDLDGEGVSGIFTEQADAWFYKRNLSPMASIVEAGLRRPVPVFAPIELIACKPLFDTIEAPTWQFVDLAGDGRPHFTRFDRPIAGFFTHTTDGTWDQFTTFRSQPNVSIRDPNLRFIDLTGDGLADLLLTSDDGFTWHRSLGESGFASAVRTAPVGQEALGPRLVFADGEQSIYLADMSGDGLTDLVRIQNGQVCYWPNVGYGRFGAKVTMDNAPWFDEPDQFAQSRIRLADVDGSGLIDIIYLGRRGTTVYFNQAGNGWSAGTRLAQAPPFEHTAAVQAIDLFGNGTACLVWSSPLPGAARRPMRYIDLMGGQKPHLLIRIVNNLGAETLVEYAASTKFYVADRSAGRPWITKLPFPVHVVEKVTVRDRWRGTSFSTTCSYHHGYFDGIEREFRGFGRVEQVDAESFGTFAAANASSPYVTDDLTLYQPPVKTITWFHTGAPIEGGGPLPASFAQEYFPHSLSSLPIATTADQIFTEKRASGPDLGSDAMSAHEWRQALRACKGMMLRQEIYELDVDELEAGTHVPVKIFSAATQEYAVRRVQPAGVNPHAVFLVTPTESISYHYELDLRPPAVRTSSPHVVKPDPRIVHTLNLRADEIGNVEQSVVVGYERPRWHDDDALDAAALSLIRDVQGERQVTYTETHYTRDALDSDPNPVVAFPYHRRRQPWEVLTYELTNISPAHGRYFSLIDLRGYRLSDTLPGQGTTSVNELPYHQLVPPPGTASTATAHKRKIEHIVTRFFDEALQAALAPGLLSRLGLVYERYKLALTRDLLVAVLGTKFNAAIEAVLNDRHESGYCSDATVLGSAGTDRWWMRSGVAGFGAQASEHFYLPEVYTDAFEQDTRLEYEERYRLFVRSSTDSLGNRTAVFSRGTPPRPRYDYRVLAPLELEDRNGNRTETIFDALGMPAAIAVKGKGNQGDALNGYTPALANPDLATVLGYFDLATLTPENARAHFSPILGDATTRFLYHFGETVTAGVPAWAQRPAGACTILRERHVASLATTDPPSPLQVAFECSDGMGTVLMKRSQAEPDAGGTDLRWIVSGKTLLNNKGNAVKQYEPYFSVSPVCCAEGDVHEEEGVTSLMYYDSLSRLIRTEMPDGTFSRVEFSPWHTQSFDANDTVEESPWYEARTPTSNATSADKRAARLARAHRDTPTTSILDSLGRDVITIAHNRIEDAAGQVTIDGTHYRDQAYLTFTKLDAKGQSLWLRDARRNLVLQYISPPKPTQATAEPDQNHIEATPTTSAPCYDLTGKVLLQHSMDAGNRWALCDSQGQALFRWDINETQDGTTLVGEDRLYATKYDELRRPTEQWLTAGTTSLMIERLTYVDATRLGLFPTLASAQSRNLCGLLYQHYNSSGLVQNERADFDGNLTETRRQFLLDHTTSRPDFQIDPAAALDGEAFVQITTFDALKRITQLLDWHRPTTNARLAVHDFHYNARGLLQSQDHIIRATRSAGPPGYDTTSAQTATIISSVRYNAKGQRELIYYGNETTTRFDYDRYTFRVVQRRTTRPNYDPAFPSAIAQFKNASVVQNLYYTYDPVGNVTEIYDDAYEVAFFDNQAIQPQSSYTYDATYRLIRATGREHIAADVVPDATEPLPQSVTFPVGANDPNRLRTFEQRYRYDAVGNFLEVRHWAGQERWVRRYTPATDSNKLSNTWLGTDTMHATIYDHDTHGNIRNVANVGTEFYFRWDHRDMLAAINRGGGGWVYYQYDDAKQRTRKVSESQNGTKQWERLYLGGFEIFRRYAGGTLVEEIESHDLLDGDRRVVLVEDVLQTNRNGVALGALYRYQYTSHLGSVCLELDDQAGVISYEEYHPFGTSAYRTARSQVETPKRYRYAGSERDEESGLSYHGARYYLAWLGRWSAIDPLLLSQPVRTLNGYIYADNQPINASDPGGRDIVVRPDSKLTATQFVALIRKSQELPEAVRNAFSVKKPPKGQKESNVIVVNLSVTGAREPLPEWFTSIQRASAQNEWELTTGVTSVTGSGSILKADAGEDPKQKPGYFNQLGTQWIPDDMTTPKDITVGTTIPSYQWKFELAAADRAKMSGYRNLQTHSDKGLIVVSLETITQGEPRAFSSSARARALIHELALHAGRMSGQLEGKTGDTRVRQPAAHGDPLVAAWDEDIDARFMKSPTFADEIATPDAGQPSPAPDAGRPLPAPAPPQPKLPNPTLKLSPPR
jgi:RHS repeat-associated protein